MTKKVSTIILVFLIISILFCGCSKEASAYKKGSAAMESGQYLEAIDHFTQAGEYEDASAKILESYYQLAVAAQNETDYAKAIEYYTHSENYSDSANRITECEHLDAIKNDNDPPVINGFDEYLMVQCGTEFNLNAYVEEHITITDNVTIDEMSYTISCDSDVYAHRSGVVDTTNYGDYLVTISAKDEAKNEGVTEFTLVLDPIYYSEDNLTPLVYDGEFATVQLLRVEHGYIQGMDQYMFTFEVENKTNNAIDVYFGGRYTTANFINKEKLTVNKKTNAYDKWLNAQTTSEPGDAFYAAADAIRHLWQVMNGTGEIRGNTGTKKFSAALEYILPEEKYDEIIQSDASLRQYLRNLQNILKMDYRGNVTDIKIDNITKTLYAEGILVKKDSKATGMNQWDIKEGSTIKDFSQILNISEELTHAIIGMFNRNGWSFCIKEDGVITFTDATDQVEKEETNSDKPIRTIDPSKRYQLSTYYTIDPIGAGNTGRAEIHIYEQDLPEGAGAIDQLTTKLCLANNNTGESFYRIPIVFDLSELN